MDWDLLDSSGGVHKCASCAYCPTYGETTVDCHACWFFFETYAQPMNCTYGQTDNDRIYSVGIETKDNGMGFWVIRCPMYKPEPFNYSTYCRTRHWRETRKNALQRAEYKCEICRTGKNLNVHHVTYEHIWDERPEDLLVCCKSCHAKIHWNDLGRTRRVLPLFNRVLSGTEEDAHDQV